MRRRTLGLISSMSATALLVACSSVSSETPGGSLAQPRGRGVIAGQKLEPAPAAPERRPRWKRRIDRLLPGKKMSVHAAYNGTRLYSHRAGNMRPPASNEKLLLSMAVFDALGPDFTIKTSAAARRVKKGVVNGSLWIKGHGDPTLSRGGAHAAVLGFGATPINTLIRRLKKAGIKRIEGDVIGSTRYFARDWDAPGWLPYFNDTQVALPTALALNGNVHKGHFTASPELILARLTHKRLQKAGIVVDGEPLAGTPPRDLRLVATVESVRLGIIVRYMNRVSSNFFAEMLGKLLDAKTGGPPGTIRGGAQRLKRWAKVAGVEVKAYDSSGLSYDNRMSARGMVDLLEAAKERPWAWKLRHGLASGGKGTLENRFRRVRLRAKTGTLNGVSTLSGWVWLQRAGAWAEFSIMSRGLDKSRAVELEDRIVRILSRRAR